MQDDSGETGPIGAIKSTPILRPAGSSKWYFVGEFIILCCGEIKFHITAGQKSKTGKIQLELYLMWLLLLLN